MSNGEASIICYARINDGNHYMKMTGVLALEGLWKRVDLKEKYIYVSMYGLELVNFAWRI